MFEQERPGAAFAHYLIHQLAQGDARNVVRFDCRLLVSQVPIARRPADGADFNSVVVGELGRECRYVDGVTGNAFGRPHQLKECVPNEAMLRHRTRAMATFCSLVHGSLTLVPQGICVRLASAGHLPPLVLHADGTVQTLPAGGTVLGIYPDPDLPESEFLLAPGATLLLYTDGVTEARGPDSDYGLDRVTDLLHSCTGETADDIAEQLTRNVLTFQAGRPRDDIALLVLQATPPSPPMPTGSASIGSSARGERAPADATTRAGCRRWEQVLVRAALPSCEAHDVAIATRTRRCRRSVGESSRPTHG